MKKTARVIATGLALAIGAASLAAPVQAMDMKDGKMMMHKKKKMKMHKKKMKHHMMKKDGMKKM